MINKKQVIQEYVISTIGAVLTALGLVCFLIPNNIAAGGASGIAIVLNSFLPFSVGVLMYAVNIVLFIVAFLTIGKEFGVRTIYCAFLVTFLVDLFERVDMIPKYHDEDLFVSVFFGVAISALGMAITFSQNSSTGGTDILARIANKFFGLSMGVALLMIDFVIAIAAGFTYDLRIGLYSIISVIFTGLTVDYLLKLIDTNITLIIISTKEKDIAEYVTTHLERGASYLKGEGVYTSDQKNLLFVAIKRREMSDVIRHIRKIDQNAFVIAQEASHVIGEGFKNINKVF
jgi:uncharacterized membrane-anchored protein YitT (DUF2179 family)